MSGVAVVSRWRARGRWCVVATTTRLRTVEVADLVPSDLASWRELRCRLERRQAVRTFGRRFRQDPAAYLKAIEDSLINQALPS